MDAIVKLETMRFYASHGCYETEQRVGGRFSVDLSYSYNAAGVIATDNIEKAVSYLDIYAITAQEMAIPSATIEHVAKRIIAKLMSEFAAIKFVEISVAKITPPLGGDIERVSVTLRSER